MPQKFPSSDRVLSLVFGCFVLGLSVGGVHDTHADDPALLVERYCFDCHDSGTREADVDLESVIKTGELNAELVFENVATKKMPPSGADQPAAAERRAILGWLAERQHGPSPPPPGRLSRFEFVHSLNDLLAVELNLANEIPDDRGTYAFDSDRRIQFSREMLGSYFSVADAMLDEALPRDGFCRERVWTTNKLKDSHQTYNIYLRDYLDGVLFSWTRANNGNSYSFFYDNFDPPVAGWYELTFDAAKVGDFDEDVSIQVHAGKYYYADDRPQPQRLLDVISLGDRAVKSYTCRAYLKPGENVSVHCYSQHTFRKKNPQQGAYIRQLKARGPLQSHWPPKSIQNIFTGLPVEAATREGAVPIRESEAVEYRTNLRRIGGSITVSSEQDGMPKQRMQDGSNKTYWRSLSVPADGPHFVILENPRAAVIEGLSYATYSGGNGDGQVKQYAIQLSEDGEAWGEPIVEGDLEIRLANEQPIHFPHPVRSRFIKFLVTEVVSKGEQSHAAVARLDVVVAPSDGVEPGVERDAVVVASRSPDDLKKVVRRFAKRAFSAELADDELEPYFSVGLERLNAGDDLVQATKAAIKSVLVSPRFLVAPRRPVHKGRVDIRELARIVWLSVPDDELLKFVAEWQNETSPESSSHALREQILRMLADPKSDRMLESFCGQWLKLRDWHKVSPSLKLYPQYDDLLEYFLPIETRLYLGHLIRENMPVSHLIDSDYTFLNQRLARHYGIEGVIGQGLRKVSFDTDVPRGGLLTMGSILKVTTDGFDTSPILRGAWVSRNIVGNPLSPPPASVKAIEPEHDSSAVTLREQIQQHKSDPNCYACHRRIDPYGFALEQFDSTGQWRDRYRFEKAHRGTFQFRLEGYHELAGEVDASGKIVDEEFEDVFGLKAILLSEAQNVAYNFARKFFEYANGYQPSLAQRIDLLDMLGNPEDCRMRDLVTSILIYSLTGNTP